MCGLAGVLLQAGTADPAVLHAMARRLQHRGPDGAGLWHEGRAGLAHNRLAIIDLAGGAQPLANEDGSLVLVANGEIYNFVELRRELEALGHRFATHSDSETILHAYEAWGDDCVTRLHGMFAFALFDRGRQRLLLARDRLGIKPLFYLARGDGFYFASELKGLLPVLERRAIEPAALAQFLQNNFSSGRQTILAGVHRVLPGERVVVEAGGDIRHTPYWTPFAAAPLAIDFESALRHFDTLMDTVMRIHMRTDVPYGLFLSGGVDSSVLLALLARASAAPIRTFSVGFTGHSVNNELAVAERTAAAFGARHTALTLDADGLLGRLPHCVWAADELMGDYANLPLSALAERAGGELKVVFSGEGGDEVFAGYGRYRASPVKRWLAAWRAPKTRGFRAGGAFSGVSAAHFNGALAEAMRHAREPFEAAWQRAPAHFSRLQKMQATDIATWLADDLLVKADRILMAWGVEGRVPYLDHRVVEFGLGLPDDFKVAGKHGKRFLKHWAERLLPKDQLWARKSGFTVPVREWLSGARLSAIEGALCENPAIGEWFAADAVRTLVARQRRHGRDSQALWALLQFAIWHTVFLRHDGERPPTHADVIDYIRGA
jgi:asparagine synthase (glutamine-hydrolysing)